MQTTMDMPISERVGWAANRCYCWGNPQWDHQHDEIDRRCRRCQEFTTVNDRAIVADGFVHAECMHVGEEIA